MQVVVVWVAIPCVANFKVSKQSLQCGGRDLKLVKTAMVLEKMITKIFEWAAMCCSGKAEHIKVPVVNSIKEGVQVLWDHHQLRGGHSSVDLLYEYSSPDGICYRSECWMLFLNLDNLQVLVTIF